MNKIEWSRKALKQLRKIPLHVRRNIFQTTSDKLIDFAHCRNVKTLKNHRYDFRLRVGNYRVFFNYDGSVKIAMVEEVKKKR